MNKRDILNKIADAHYELAELYQSLASEQSGSSSAAVEADVPPAPASTFNDFDERPLPPRQEPTGDQGSEANCPKHRKPYKDGNYGPYCTSTTDDEAWANKRGYCTINPKNAHKWLRIQAAAGTP